MLRREGHRSLTWLSKIPGKAAGSVQKPPQSQGMKALKTGVSFPRKAKGKVSSGPIRATPIAALGTPLPNASLAILSC